MEFLHEKFDAGAECRRGEVDDDGQEADVKDDEPFAPTWPTDRTD
jgi:hypothetical protein